MKQCKIFAKAQSLSSKFFFPNLPLNFIKGPYESLLKFCPFCRNKSEQNVGNG